MKLLSKLVCATAGLASIGSVYANNNDDFLRKVIEGDGYVVNRELSESICGVDDLQHVENYDNRYAQLGFNAAFVDNNQSSVGALKTRATNGSGSYCSGTLISHNLFLTASHCVDASTTNEFVAFNYQRNGATGAVRAQEFFGIVSVVEDGNDNNLDYAILELEGNPGNDYGWRNVQAQTPGEIIIIQHPRGEVKQLDAGNDVIADGDRLRYAQLDTEPGSSGSGVLNATGNVVAVHTNGGCNTNGGRNSGVSMAAIEPVSTVLPIESKILGLTSFGYNTGGWRVDLHPRTTADINGDGFADVVGFGNAGVYTALSNGDGTFKASKLGLNSFGYNTGGWRVEQHPRTMGDINGDGLADIIGFGNAGVYTALSNGDGTFRASKLGLKSFGYNTGGWRVEQHPRTVADVNGDGLADIVGFGHAGVYTALSNGDGTFKPHSLGLKSFGYNTGGWRVEQHPRTAADVNGDGLADIVGFGHAGVYTALSNGNGTFQPAKLGIKSFGYNTGGWRVDQHPRMMADVNGDGLADIVGFGHVGVYTSLSNSDGTFAAANLVLKDFVQSVGGWQVDKHPRTMADVNGDGLADIVGFADAGVYTFLTRR